MTFPPGTPLEKMLKTRTFDSLRRGGEILTVRDMADKSGYSPKHIHRLCREGRLSCFHRGVSSQKARLYFLGWQLRELFTYRDAREKRN